MNSWLICNPVLRSVSTDHMKYYTRDYHIIVVILVKINAESTEGPFNLIIREEAV